MKRFLIIFSVSVVIFISALVWWRYYFVFGEGVKAGNLNFVVKKGYLFKTWEGRIIQTGFKSSSLSGLTSNEFEFSIQSDSIAHVLELCSGKIVELRYNEYFNPLPWRGMSNYVVIDIVSIKEIDPDISNPIFK